jgi:cytochrome c-type biogenesis protein CcmH/NrfG
LERFYEWKDSSVLLFLAKAYFEAEKYAEARATLLKVPSEPYA